MRKSVSWAAMVAMVVFAFSATAGTVRKRPAAKKGGTASSSRTATSKSGRTARYAPRSTAKKGSTVAAKDSGGTSKTATSARRGKSGSKKTAQTWRNRQMAPTPERYREIQQALASKGYLRPEEATGAWGDASVDALKRFQTDQKLDPNGKINSLSLIALGLGPKRDTASAQKPAGAPAAQEAVDR